MTTGETQRYPTEQEQAAQRERNTFQIGLWSGILFSLISIVSTISTIQTGLYAFGGIALTTIIAVISFLTAYLARRGNARAGSSILVSSILLLSLSLPLFAKGQGIPLAVLTIVIISGVAGHTLTNRWAARASIASIIIGLIIIISDTFLPDPGIPNDPRITNIIAAIAGTIYAGIFLRRFGTYPLQTKLIIAFTAITLVPIFVLSVYNSNTTRNILTQQAETELSSSAIETATSIDSYISSQLDIVRTEAQQPSLARYLQSEFLDQAENETTALQTLLTFARKDPVFIVSYSLLNTQGKNVLSTDQFQIGSDESSYQYFKIPITNGTPYISNILFKSSYPTFYFTAPIRTENGTIVGVLKGEYYASIFQSIVQSASNERENDLQLLIFDRDTLLRIAGTSERENNYLSYKELSPSQILELQTQQKLPPGVYEQAIVPSSDLAAGIENIENQPIFKITKGARNAANFIVAGKALSTQPWVVISQQTVEKIYAQAETQARANVLWSLGLTIFSLLAAISVTRVISLPVRMLAQVAEQITSGDFSAQANITTNDEVGQLSRVFNEMTTQLSQTLAGLEERVEERTKELQAANQQSSQRARQLQSIADVSKIITREQNTEKLLPLIADIVSDRFGYYHIGIFLLDETRRMAVLQASNSPGGQRMLANGHKLTIGSGSIVGYAALTGKPRIALDVGEDAIFFNNPNLPETHSEMALPLIIRGKTIGVIDLQSKQRGAFTQEDIDILSILADQVAIAIENARLFQQTQIALAESQAIAQSFLRQEWSALARRQTTIGYIHTGTGGKTLSSPAQADEIEQALRKGAVVKKEHKTEEGTKPTVAIPITLGEQVIGVIRVQSPHKEHAWSVEEINLLRSISERIGLALDNARLVATSQKRAAKERTIGEIAAKISAATDIDSILQTAAQEIGRALSSSDVIIQLKESEEE